MQHFKQFFLTLSTCMLIGCGGDNTTTLLIPDITSIAIDESNITIYPTDKATLLHTTAIYTDGSKEDITNYVIWSETNSSLVSMSVNTINVKANGGDTNISITYDRFQDSQSLHVHKLTAFHTIYPDVNATGEYIFKVEGSFDNNETNRTLVNNVQWYATNNATIDVDTDGLAHITFLTGETNVTTTVFYETNTSATLAPQSKIFTIK